MIWIYKKKYFIEKIIKQLHLIEKKKLYYFIN